MFVLYAGFIGLICLLLALDLGVFHKKAHVVSAKEGLAWSALWISIGLAFTGLVYLGYEHHVLGLGLHTDASRTPRMVEGVGMVYNDGGSGALRYVTGFLVEKSLAVDNIFVIAMLFSFLKVPAL